MFLPHTSQKKLSLVRTHVANSSGVEFNLLKLIMLKLQLKSTRLETSGTPSIATAYLETYDELL